MSVSVYKVVMVNAYIEYFHVINERYNQNWFIYCGFQPSYWQRCHWFCLQRLVLAYSGFKVDTHEPVAVKAIKMSQVNNEVTQYLLDGQKKAMSTIKSPYVVKTHDIIQQADYCYIVMELCSNGTLKDHIQAKGRPCITQAN